MRRPLVFIALVSVLAISSWPRSASAQVSIWLQKGVSGVGAAVVLGYNKDQSTYGVNGGYSINGFVDLDLTAAYLSFPEDFGPGDLQGYAIEPRIEVHPLKQGPHMPISLGIGASAAKFFFVSDTLDSRDQTLDGWNVNADASVYRFFKLAPRFGITPAVGAGFVHSWAGLKSRSGTDSSTDDTFRFAVGTYFAYLDDGGRIWGVAPAVSVGDDDVTTVSVQA